MGMHIDERDLKQSAALFERGADAGWYAALQPGIVRFIEDRLSGDARDVTLVAAWQILAAFHERLGVWPERVATALLERAEEASLREARREAPVWVEGCATRQPVLVAWIADLMNDPPIPLDPEERRDAGMALVAVVYALDEASTGRSVPPEVYGRA